MPSRGRRAATSGTRPRRQRRQLSQLWAAGVLHAPKERRARGTSARAFGQGPRGSLLRSRMFRGFDTWITPMPSCTGPLPWRRSSPASRRAARCPGSSSSVCPTTTRPVQVPARGRGRPAWGDNDSGNGAARRGPVQEPVLAADEDGDLRGRGRRPERLGPRRRHRTVTALAISHLYQAAERSSPTAASTSSMGWWTIELILGLEPHVAIRRSPRPMFNVLYEPAGL